MSAVGFDFGTFSTKISVVPRGANGNAFVILNEASNRTTPSLVAFGAKHRDIGESAKTKIASNYKNTVGSFKRLAGRTLKDPDIQIEQKFISAPLVDVGREVGVEVSYQGKKETFSATQLMGMYFNSTKNIASASLGIPVTDIVISCPPWFTDLQRRSMMDAAEIAGLNLLRLINEPAAAALQYAAQNHKSLPTAEEKSTRVCFIDIGHSAYTCSIMEFRKGEGVVKSIAYDRHFGGRNFDVAIVDHFAKVFKEKYKIDIYTNPKALARVGEAAEQMKRKLSANTQTPINIDNVVNDVDVSGMLKREELEELVKPLLDRVTVPLEQALAEAKLKVEDIDSVELIGGCTRVPALKERISKFFGKQLSFTLNQDEAVAMGCALSSSHLSPYFRARDFSVHEIVNYPIEFIWDQSPDIPDEDTSLTVFNKGNIMPSTKILTFYRKQPFDLEARYAKPEMLPGKPDPWIGRFSVKGVKADSKDDFMICKLKARLNLSGVLSVESGYFIEDVEVEEPIPEEKGGEKKDDEAMETDPPNGSAVPKPKTRKVKKQVRKGDLPIVAGTASLDQATKAAAAERENMLMMDDKLAIDTANKKNDLEGYLLELQGKIDDTYAEFASNEEREKLRTAIEEGLFWMEDFANDDTTIGVYIAKMDEIRFIAGPIVARYLDKVEEERQAALKVEEEKAAKRKAEAEAKRKADEAAKKAEEASKKAKESKKEAAKSGTATPATDGEDVDMKDAETVKPDAVSEPLDEEKK